MSIWYRVLFCGVSVLPGFAAVAAAQDELSETVWIVTPEGELLGWPDPEAGNATGEFKPFAVFGPTPGACLEHLCYHGWALLLAPGPLDLASLCDPERHLKKTDQLLFDEILVVGHSPDGLAESRVDRARRRVFLDALLCWRVVGSRGLEDGAPMLQGISKAQVLDPITRLAAADIAATLEGRKPAVVDLPPLDGLPADAGVLVVIDQRRIPPWRDFWRLHRTWGVREARQTIARIGAAITPADLCAGQWYMDRECEGFYELARRFGNARVHRTVLALRFPDDAVDMSEAKILLRCEGLFETDRFRPGCEACGVKPREGPEGAIAAQFGDVDVTVTPKRLVVSRNYAVPAAGGGIPADLAKLGLGGDDAVWVHCRKVPFADRLPVKGMRSLTLRAKFEGGVAVRAEATFVDEAAARAAKAEIERWKSLELKPVELRDANPKAVAPLRTFLDSLTVTAEGASLVAQASAPGATPESLYAAVVELDALYAWEEEVAEPTDK